MIDFGGRDVFSGLFAYLESVGVQLYRRDNQWVSNATEQDVQSAIDSYTLAMAKDDVKAGVHRVAQRIRDAFVTLNSSGDAPSWGTKLAQAERYVDEETAAVTCPMLYQEAVYAATTVAAVRDRVLANAAAYQIFEGSVAGRSKALRDTVDVAIDFATLAAIDIDAGWPA